MSPQPPRARRTGAEESTTSSEASEDVLDRLRAGDIAALDEIYRVYGDRIFGVCFGILANRADAEDATQEVFLRAFQQAVKFSGKSRYSTWLLRLAANHTLNFAKAVKRRKRVSRALPEDVASPAPDPDHAVIGRERRAAVVRLLQELPPEQRLTLVLREIEGLSYFELSEVLGVPVGTVTSRLIRGREKLRALVTDSESDLLAPG